MEARNKFSASEYEADRDEICVQIYITDSILKKKLTFKDSPLYSQIFKKIQLLRRYFQSLGRKYRYKDKRFPEIFYQCRFCSIHCRFVIFFFLSKSKWPMLKSLTRTIVMF